jgi:poly-gamma-glutamate synthesis protein (capsule biosynthesis protein)
MRVPLALLLLSSACAVASPDGDDDTGEAGEASESAVVPLPRTDETAPAAALAAQALETTDLLDVRGVGDSGWSNTHEKDALAADFGAALDRFDPTGVAYRADLSFINWETVVGSRCDVFGSVYTPGRSYAFVSRPENLVQASERGFNLVGLSNNHSRDCHGSPETALRGEVASSDMTAANVEALGDRSWIVAGVSSSRDHGDASRARVRTFRVKGRDVRVAFASTYMGRPSCPRASCKGDKTLLLESLRDAPADLRVLAIHSMAAADQEELVSLGVEFVERYGGDVVFGHGPHVWKPVRVVRKQAGGTGVVFESLGNFLHPALGAQSKNFIGRALFDPTTLRLRQVQLLPIANAGRDVRFSSADASAVPANLRWSAAPRGVFANVKP